MDRLQAKSNLNIGENSSLYYMGATLAGAPTGVTGMEMTTNPVSVVSDVVLYPNKVKINSMRYNQTITSQNKKKKSVQNQLSASGEISLLKDNVLGFKNLKIKTLQPTNAKIFNVLTKNKQLIKEYSQLI